jgi:carbonic anhydrase/acetyltransferase-like protein (isoleucine patch superfamily)
MPIPIKNKLQIAELCIKPQQGAGVDYELLRALRGFKGREKALRIIRDEDKGNALVFYKSDDGSWISDSVCIPESTAIGKCSIIMPRAIISGNARIGDFAVLCPNSVVSDGAEISYGAVIGEMAYVEKGAVVSKFANVPKMAYVLGDKIMPKASRGTVCIDFDGTIADTIPKVLQMLNNRYGKNISISDIKQYYSLNAFYGITQTELNHAFAELLIENWNVGLVDASIPAIIRKFNCFFDTYIITASVAPVCYIEKWIKDKWVDIKSIVRLDKKEEFANGDVFIDDGPHVVHSIAISGKKAILLKKPYYEYDNEIEHENIVHASDWKSIEGEVFKLLGNAK